MHHCTHVKAADLNPRLVGQWLQKHWKLSSTLLLSKLLSSVEAPNRFDGPSRATGPTLASAPAPTPASTPATQQAASARDAFVQALGSVLSEAPPLQRKAMVNELVRLLEKDNSPARSEPVLAVHGGLGLALLRQGLHLLGRNPRFLDLEDDDSVLSSARIFLPPQVQALIAGHTHGPRVSTRTRPRYFNTGTWLPVGTLPEGDLKVTLDLLEKDLWRPESPCTFLEARVERDAWQLRLGKVTPEGSTVWPGPVEP